MNKLKYFYAGLVFFSFINSAAFAERRKVFCFDKELLNQLIMDGELIKDQRSLDGDRTEFRVREVINSEYLNHIALELKKCWDQGLNSKDHTLEEEFYSKFAEKVQEGLKRLDRAGKQLRYPAPYDAKVGLDGEWDFKSLEDRFISLRESKTSFARLGGKPAKITKPDIIPKSSEKSLKKVPVKNSRNNWLQLDQDNWVIRVLEKDYLDDEIYRPRMPLTLVPANIGSLSAVLSFDVRASDCRVQTQTANQRWRQALNSEGNEKLRDQIKNSLFREMKKSDALWNIAEESFERAGEKLEMLLFYIFRSSICDSFNTGTLRGVLDYLEEADLLPPDWKWDILDPSSGWGDRVTSALARKKGNVRSYVGIDPNPAVQPVYKSIIDVVGSAAKELNIGLPSVCMIRAQAESVDYKKVYNGRPMNMGLCENSIGSNEVLSHPNLIFTSPPYFKAELYTQNFDALKLQSSRFGSQEDWLNEFLYKSVDLAIADLEMGGYLAYNLADVQGSISITKALNTHLETLNNDHFEMQFLIVLGMRMGGQKVAEPIWIWKKVPRGLGRESSSYGNYSGQTTAVKKQKLEESF